MGVAQPGPVHDDRRHGGRHDDGDAADAALGAGAAAVERRRRRPGWSARSSRRRVCVPTSSACSSRSMRARAAASPRGWSGSWPARGASRRRSFISSVDARSDAVRGRGRPNAPKPSSSRAPKQATTPGSSGTTGRSGRNHHAGRETQRGGDRGRSQKGLRAAASLVANRSPLGDAFHEQITRSAAGFAGPFAIAIARGIDRQEAIGARLNILVPVTGTPVSRHGAELAIALAQASAGYGDCPPRGRWPEEASLMAATGRRGIGASEQRRCDHPRGCLAG